MGYFDRLEDQVRFKPDTIREMEITFLHIDTADYFGATSSCNYFSGEFIYGLSDSFNIPGVASTLILCRDEGVSSWEDWYYEALITSNAYNIRGNSLRLTSPENEVVFRIDE